MRRMPALVVLLAAGSSVATECLLKDQCEQFLTSLGVDSNYLDRAHDRCYCSVCYRDSYPDIVDTDGPHPYVIPRYSRG